MLLSMTGFGEARRQDEARTVGVEVRSVNGRHLKLSSRISEPFAALEPEIERLVRSRMKRGTVQLNLRVESLRRPEDYRLNLAALEGYRAQLLTFLGDGPAPPDFFSALLSLPGVVDSSRQVADDPKESWPALEPLIAEALDQLHRSRLDEGRSMAQELRSLASEITRQLEQIASRGPEVVSSYRDRLTERIASLIKDRGVTLEPEHLIREVAIFAERSDIAEEITRLRAHLDQFDTILSSPDDSPGRKLEFVVQEMGRETNTIGSKANDVDISRAVVEIKGSLEKIRELIQNVE